MMKPEIDSYSYCDQPYLAPLAKRAERLAAKRKPGLYLTVVEHNSWCGIWSGNLCNCNPTVRPANRQERRRLLKGN